MTEIQQNTQPIGINSEVTTASTTNTNSVEDVLARLEEKLDKYYLKSASETQPVLDQKEQRKGTPERKTWNWNDTGVLMTEHELFNVGKDALGISVDQAYARQDEVGNMIKSVIEYLQTDSPTAIYRFLSRFARTTPNRSISGMRRDLELYFAENQQEGGAI